MPVEWKCLHFSELKEIDWSNLTSQFCVSGYLSGVSIRRGEKEDFSTSPAAPLEMTRDLLCHFDRAKRAEKSSSTWERTKRPPNVPSAVLEHAASNKNTPK